MITIINETSDYIYCLCPKHKDTKPSLVAAKTGPFAGMFCCFGCGYRGLAVDLGLDFVVHPRATKPPQDWAKWQRQVHENTPDGVIKQAELARDWNVSVADLYRLGYGWDGESHTFPMFNENSEIVGIQRRFPNGRKVCVEGSRLGLFLPSGWPSARDSLLITEGVSDCAVALNIQFLAIGRPSAMYGERLILGWLRKQWRGSNKILVVADTDKIGKEGAINLQKILIQHGWCCDIFIPPAKDLREAITNFGKTEIKDMLDGWSCGVFTPPAEDL